MPRFGDPDDGNVGQQHTAGHFGFSAVRLNDLGATEYTLVGIAVDASSSVSMFRDEICGAVRSVVEACRSSPRSDNLMLRTTTFNQRLAETHGFKPLNQCNPADYDGFVKPSGSTALYDATIDCVEAVHNFGEQLSKADFDVNGIIFVITDGEENTSTIDNPVEVKKALEQAVRSEQLESILTILIAVNAGQSSKWLDDFNKDVGFTQYENIGSADVKTLTRLADFVSQSISSQSKALGTGQASQTLVF